MTDVEILVLYSGQKWQNDPVADCVSMGPLLGGVFEWQLGCSGPAFEYGAIGGVFKWQLGCGG